MKKHRSPLIAGGLAAAVAEPAALLLAAGLVAWAVSTAVDVAFKSPLGQEATAAAADAIFNGLINADSNIANLLGNPALGLNPSDIFNALYNAEANFFSPHQAAGPGFMGAVQKFFNNATRDPLVIDINGTGLNLTGISSSSPSFDWGDSEALSPTGWIGAGTGFLAITNGSDQVAAQNLFGPGSSDGFAALKALDSNGDGVINESDSNFANLVVWQDLNGDGVAQSNELQTLSQLGIVSISLNPTADDETINGNDIVSYATVTMADGTTREIADVGFAQSVEYTPNSGEGAVSSAAAALPDLQGYGQVASLRVAMTQDANLLSYVQSFAASGGSDSTSLDSAISQIMFEWAGVTNVDPSSRGSLFDARKLEFLEKFLGVPFAGLGGSNPFLTHQAETLNSAYAAAFDGIKARLLIQIPDSPLSQIFTLNAATDTIGLASTLGWTLTAIGALAPSDAASAIGYWADALTVFNEYSSDAGGMGTDSDALTAAFTALAPRVFSESVIQAAVNGTLQYIDASAEFASAAASRVVYGGEGTDLVLITAPGVTFVNQAGNDDVVIGADAGNVTINDGEAPSTSQNVLSFAQVDSLSDLSISGDAAGDIVITYDTAGDAVTIVNGLFNGGSLGSLVLDDGTTLTRAQVLALADIGTATNTMLYGSPGADLFDPKGYAHYAQGNGGADTFVYDTGYGALEINEDGGWQAPSTAVLQFGAGIVPSQISVSADSSGDIFLTDGVSGDQIKLDGERNLSILGASEWGVAGVTFADGTTWTRAQLIAQSLIASPTNQTLYGTGGADTFVYHSGDGAVEVNEYTGGSANSTAVLQLGSGITLADLTASFDSSGDEILTDGVTGDQIKLDGETIINWSGGYFTSHGVSQLELSDGTTLDRQDLLNLATTGSPTQTSLYGTSNADTFDSKGYATYEQGNGGADAFVYNSGYGALEISEDGGWQTPSSAVLQFGAGIAPSQISVSADSSGDIFITDGVTGDQIKLDGERNLSILGAAEYGVAQVTFADGTSWTRAQLIVQSLTASPTNQTLYGTGGADTFVYASGDGAVEVVEYTGGSANSTAVLQLGSGITLADLTASFDSSGDEILTDGVTGDQIKLDGETIINWSGGYFTSHGVSELELSDGTTLDRQDLLNLATTGSPTQTSLYGTGNADTFDSKGYATYEQGNGGADAFVYNSGYGALEINEDAGWQTTSTAVLQFGAGIDPSDLSVTGDSSGDIFITDGVTGDQIKLDGQKNLTYMGVSETGVSQVTFADGTSWTRAQLIAQSLIASPTNQTLYGTGGADTFVYASGDGAVEVKEDTGGSANSTAVLQLGSGITLADLTASFDSSGDEILTDGVTGDQIKLDGEANVVWNGGYHTSQGVALVNFADGTSIDRQQLLNIETTGGPGRTALYGSSGANVFDSRGYAHYEQGNGGADTFIYNSGYGALEISEDGGWQTPSSAVLQFGAGIAPSQISVSADSSGDIFLTDGVSGDQIKLDGQKNLTYMGVPETGVSQVTFADGTTWTRAQLIAQSLIASPTNQTLYGTGGADTFVYASGDGAVEVVEYTGGSANSTAVLQLGSGITLADLTASFDSSGDEILTDGVTGDQIKLDGESIINWSGGYFTSHGVSQLELSDGTTLNRQDLLNLATTGSAGHTTLYGTSNADTFDSKGYATYEQGNGGADAFIYNSGYGALEINEDAGWQTTSTAVLQFGAGIDPGDLSVTGDSSGDIFITDGVTGDQIKLDGQKNLTYMGVSETGVSQVTFADGTTWTRAQLIAQSLIASSTNQTLYGTGGADTFVYASGDGAVEVNEYTGGSANSTAVLQLGSGITLADLTASFDSSGDEILTDGVTGDQIKLDGETIINWSGGYFTSHGVSQLELSDGTTLDRQDLLNLATTGSPTQTSLYGTGNADTFDSKGYATYEQGNGGADTYLFGRGYGPLEINNSPGSSSAAGAVDLKSDIDPDQIWFQKSGDNLVVDLYGTYDHVTIDGWYGSNGSAKVADFVTSTGTTLSSSSVDQLVQAMATFASNYASTTGQTFDPRVASSQTITDSSVLAAVNSAWQ